MWQAVKQLFFVALFFAVFLFSVTTTNAQVSVTTVPGVLPDGATYLIQVPSNWNGTLFLYSHGYVVPGSPNPARNVGDPVTGAFLLGEGFANPNAVQYLEQNIIFDGAINIPVLTMHTTGDGLVINENESAYRTIVDLTGNHKFLRQTFVSRAGHCTFTPGETIAAVNTLLARVETGHWSAVDANTLNGDATALGSNFIFEANGAIVPTAPAFVEFLSGPYPRPFDSLAVLCPKGTNQGCPFAFLLQH